MCLHMLIYPYTLSNIDYTYSWIFGANICIIVIFCVLLFWKNMLKILRILFSEYIFE